MKFVKKNEDSLIVLWCVVFMSLILIGIIMPLGYIVAGIKIPNALLLTYLSIIGLWIFLPITITSLHYIKKLH